MPESPPASPDTPTDPPLELLEARPRWAARARWSLLAAAWICFVVSLALPASNLNLFLRWRGEATGAEFHEWLLLRLPRYVGGLALRGDFAYLPIMDLAWWVAAVAATLLFLITPLLMRARLGPARILVLRYLALVLLAYPITVSLPVQLRYPYPRVGLWLLAAAHALTLVALWCPWPRVVSRATYFAVEPVAEKPSAGA